MSLKGSLCCVLVLLLILISGCGVMDYVFPDDQEPPDQNGELVPGDDDDEDDQDTIGETGPTRVMTLYFTDYQGRYTVPISYPVPLEEGIAKVMVSHLVEGGPSAKFLADRGLRALLPAGTRVRGMNIKDGVCVVDLSKEFTGTVDAVHERLMLDALVYSLTEFSTVDSVVLWVEGRVVTKLPHGTPVPAELTRSGALNPELDSVGTGSHLTIYMQLDNLAGGKLLVPLTRRVAPTTNLAGAALEQLVHGPVAASGLSPVMPVTTKVEKLTIEGSMAVVDFSSDLAQADDINLAVTAIVMTLTEFTNIDKVKITILGQAIQMPDGKTLSEPVLRPSSPNPLAF